MRPSFDDLNYFVEVANTKNLSRAAQRLGITQPSVSAAIKRLEQAFTTPLLVRNRSGVQLTRSGIALEEHSRKFMAQWEQLKTNVIRAGTDMAGTFTIGCHPSVALYTLPHLIPALKRIHPHITLNLVHDLSRKITEQIIGCEIDFGLVINPIRHPDLVIHTLFFDEVALWCSLEYDSALSAHEGVNTLYCDPNLKQSQTLLKALDLKQFQIEHSNNLEVIASLVAQSVGLGILPERVANKCPQPLRRYPHSDDVVMDELCLVHRADIQKSAASQHLKLAIKSLLTEPHYL
ncbi:Hca operon transcriptional activator HcaR [Pseudoalteromonas holothuriae]|uniref:Hca operon transcriptional activator HcaR n=1 Tax=Pseudoalteromonas holothuriae TaxID=2963714 RepID=A0A9W4QUE3_9GAMM|nr:MULTISPECIES: LysR family transcriptional regulator [unclassified Pseudoalteromonas]CAH9053678.1 Hca operon transcriptional activator HcaR [Pseudoalteromonas sp. CIP111854]CAH9061150.1 Hca operon transcriptional activator HcaR [Pseudoalteromonas sp. CIP111951]